MLSYVLYFTWTCTLFVSIHKDWPTCKRLSMCCMFFQMGCWWTTPDLNTACTLHVHIRCTWLPEVFPKNALYLSTCTLFLFNFLIFLRRMIFLYPLPRQPILAGKSLKAKRSNTNLLTKVCSAALNYEEKTKNALVLVLAEGKALFWRKKLLDIHMQGADLLQVQWNKNSLLRQIGQLARHKGSPLLNWRVSLSQVDLSGEHYDKHPCMYVKVDLNGEHRHKHPYMFVKVGISG